MEITGSCISYTASIVKPIEYYTELICSVVYLDVIILSYGVLLPGLQGLLPIQGGPGISGPWEMATSNLENPRLA
jgi:hypothetical protein